MPRTVETIVACHQEARARRCAGRPIWDLKIPVKPALQAVNAAISALKPQGELLSASKQGYFLRCKKVGLLGTYCTEALRILYVQERYALNLQSLGSRHGALRATCLDIGYSEERHKHVQKVFQL